MTEVLHRDPAITCQWDEVNREGDVDGIVPCGAISQFRVERSDGDTSFGWDGQHRGVRTSPRRGRDIYGRR